MTPSQALTALRQNAPLVHCITNYVAMNISANVTLAAGASPAMIHAVEEVSDFTPLCGALSVNIGTISAPWLEAMLAAADAANAASVPWVLDPVAHFATPYRGDAARQLMAKSPTVLRANASEIIALAGGESAAKGADSADSVTDAHTLSADLAKRQGCVVAVTGVEDFVTDGEQKVTIAGGSDLMPKVTALGCSLSALVAAYAAVTSPMHATVAALAHFAVAGEQAASAANGPGSFSVHFLDALHSVTPEDLDQARVTWH